MGIRNIPAIAETKKKRSKGNAGRIGGHSGGCSTDQMHDDWTALEGASSSFRKGRLIHG